MKFATIGFVFAFVLFAAGVRAANLDALSKPGLPEGRIINGQDAVKGAAPFIVSLQRGSHFCAASIIDEHWVLTAAHCLIFDSFEVVAGLHRLSDKSDVQVRKVQSKDYYIAHEDYDGKVGPNDIGLIYIAEPFTLNTLSRDGSPIVGKVELPSGKFEQTGAGRLFGWGADITNNLANTLQTLDVQIISYKECKEALPWNSKISPVNICSYEYNSIDGACSGDSGGPLVRTTKSGYELVGIVSWGYIPCQYTKYPSVYTWTTAYGSWIAEKIKRFVEP